MLTTFDALVDALVHHSGYTTPGSAAYLARNPGGLRVYSRFKTPETQALREFRNMIDGLQALRYDLACKLGKHETLLHLAVAYGKTPMAAKAWAGFLKRALSDDAITPGTPLSYFKEQK